MTHRSRYYEKEEIQCCDRDAQHCAEFSQGSAGPLISGPFTQGEFESIYRALKKAIIRRVTSAETDERSGYRHGHSTIPAARPRNRVSGKVVLTDDGAVDNEVPRDGGSYEQLIVGKHERRFIGFDQKIIAMHARGMTVREIQG